MTIRAEPLTAEAFAPFGQVLEVGSMEPIRINQGLCERFHDLAALEVDEAGRLGISLFLAEGRALPYRLDMLERHPLGSQAFLPMSRAPFLVIVAPDTGGTPGAPLAFVTAPGQGVNYAKGTWHGVLTPLGERQTFAVIDRIGEGQNLEEVWLESPVEIIGPGSEAP